MGQVQIHSLLLAGFLTTTLLRMPCLAQVFPPLSEDEMYDFKDMSNLNPAEQQTFFKHIAADPVLKQLVGSQGGGSKDAKLFLNLPVSTVNHRPQVKRSKYKPEVELSLNEEFVPKIKLPLPPIPKRNSKRQKTEASKLKSRKDLREKYGKRKFNSNKPLLLMPTELTEEEKSRLRFPNNKFCTETSLKSADQYFLLPWWYHYCQNMHENKKNSFKNKKVLNLDMSKYVLERVQAYKNSMKKTV